MRDVIPGFAERGLLPMLDREHWLNRTVRARITAVNSRKGTVVAEFDTTLGVREVQIIAGWMSIKGAKSAWARYMPHVDDLVLLSFDTTGEAKIVAYDTLNYAQLADLKAAGTLPQFNDLQSGEFDFMSSGGAYIRGDNSGVLSLYGGITNLQLRRDEMRADLSAPLFRLSGDSGSFRFGDVKRRKLLTDQKETQVGLTNPLKEFNVLVEQNLGGLDAIPLASLQFGHIISETLFTEELNTVTGKAYRFRARVFNGLPSVSSLDAWRVLVDEGGNFEMSVGPGGIGGSFSFVSEGGDFSAKFLNVKLDALEKVSVHGISQASVLSEGLTTVNGNTGTVLGGSEPTHPGIFGDVLLSAFGTYLDAVSGAFNSVVLGGEVAALHAVGAAAVALKGALTGMLSSNVFLSR